VQIGKTISDKSQYTKSYVQTMTKKLFAKGILKGELQTCCHCIHWVTRNDRDHYFIVEWCEKQDRMITILYDSCFQWQWNKKLK